MLIEMLVEVAADEMKDAANAADDMLVEVAADEMKDAASALLDLEHAPNERGPHRSAIHAIARKGPHVCQLHLAVKDGLAEKAP